MPQQKHSLRNIRQSQAREEILVDLAHAVEQSADLVIVTDRSGIIEYVNPAFEALTGYTKQEAIGSHSRLLKSGLHDKAFYQDLWSTILSGEVYRGALTNRKKNGELFFLEKTITPVRDLDGEIVRFISYDRDITDKRHLEAQLQQIQRMEALGAFAGGIAHDFNNLLMIMTAYAELTLEALGSEDPLRSNLSEILHAARRATDLTRQLLTFSHRASHQLQSLDVNSVISDLGRMLPRLLGEDVHLEYALGDLKKTRADAAQIEQLLMNLAGNARDAMPHGGELKIQTSMVQLDEQYVQQHPVMTPGEYILLTVSDSGEGIAPEHLPHIFEPFYTTKPKGKGTGLGLATAYAIVKQTGGYIWVYSELRRGTTFKIYLPSQDKIAAHLQQSLSPANIPGGTETILLVEDEEAVRRSERDFLVASGYRVIEAGDGESALQIAAGAENIHITITDVVLPRMDGAELARRIAALRPEMKILFVSGYSASTIAQHGLASVRLEFLEKPFTHKMLAEKIRRVLDATPRAMSAAV